MSNFRLAMLLAVVFALSPLAIDTYLPAIPMMAENLGVASGDIAVTISIYILGLALGQFIGGPLSDSRGRGGVMLLGLSVFALSSLVLATTHHVWELWAARFLQSVGGGLATVVVPAIVRDRTEGRESAKLMALLGLIMIAAPALAPSIGSLLLLVSDWRSIFVFLAIYAAFAFGVIAYFLPIRQQSNNVAASMKTPLITRYRYVLGHRVAMGYVLAQAFAFSVMMIFLTHSSSLYLEQFGVSEKVFSLLFAGNILTMALINRINSALLSHFDPPVLLRWALGLQVGACGLLVLAAYNHASIWFYAPAVMLVIGSLGGTTANSSASCLHYFPNHSGIASALLGTTQYLLAALISGVSTLFMNGTPWPMVVGMAVCSVISLVALVTMTDGNRHLPALPAA
ncbi:Bicyclomycin resistance protein [BD1-7 clade bacterium]|uniref:Bcr/CflA family efflux transporter n=1 Tax=BD1-7 clade bacterium TaxID=2029982 RepID=A0A5S9R0H1_9GAMM|nr:Bicyclomycin resistance protein [BD1-7 clade bacterium]